MPAPTLPPRRGREPKTPRQTNVTGAQSDEQATSAHPDRPTSPEPSDDRTAARQAIREARALAGSDAGTVWALTAIAHALLAQEQS